MTDWLDAANRLSQRIIDGDVVFFIGAGYSLESEGNSGTVLIARLLARFDVLCEYFLQKHLPLRHQLLPKDGEAFEARCREEVASLREGMIRTFWISRDELDPEKKFSDPDLYGNPVKFPLFCWAIARKLTQRYYELNDWMCNACSILMALVERLGDEKHVMDFVNRRERALYAALRAVETDDSARSLTASPLVNLRGMFALGDHVCMGKALFLATMGFEDAAIMSGDPERPVHEMKFQKDAQPDKALIRPRHLVLAWMAREGLCPTLLTTNYDLLLEGAFRLAGFRLNVPSEVDVARNVEARCRDRHIEVLPATRYAECTRVARDVQFFNAGGAHQTALIYKIHGCAQTYRKATHHVGDWKNYLKSVVFTFREIQNWREDSWSRDLLYTLLRTRTVAFAGYSAADPVIHDTFRSVYEDMADRRANGDDTTARGLPDRPDEIAKLAPAFLMDLIGKNEFHGMEILRSASRSVGERLPRLSQHPNQFSFQMENRGRAGGGTPTLDELQEWIFRCAMRKQQRQILKMHLWSVTRTIWHGPQPVEEIQDVITTFDEMVDAEQNAASRAHRRKRAPEVCRRLTPWITVFHRLLMREFALAEAIESPTLSQRTKVEKCLRESPWYFPLADRPAWAAWSVVVEIALRRMVSMLHFALGPQDDELAKNRLARWASETRLIWPVDRQPNDQKFDPADSDASLRTASTPDDNAWRKFCPTLEFNCERLGSAPSELVIRVRSSRDEELMADSIVLHRDRRVWSLADTAIPWPDEEHESRQKTDSDFRQTPGAELLWDIAKLQAGGLLEASKPDSRLILRIRQCLSNSEAVDSDRGAPK
ncbi:hypothetical protein GC176_13590 [bacterium]|nr:hypothetical protein [bacterium]